jgi:hypothetical protein
MTEQSQAAQTPHDAHDAHGAPPQGSKRVVHRVCIQCNQMFPVTPENFDAKQCSNCHKG